MLIPHAIRDFGQVFLDLMYYNLAIKYFYFDGFGLNLMFMKSVRNNAPISPSAYRLHNVSVHYKLPVSAFRQ